MSSGVKDLVLKGNDNYLVPSRAYPTTAVLSTPKTFDFCVQGYSSFILQLNYTYGAATGLTFSFTEYDQGGAGTTPFSTPPGAVVTKTNISTGTIAADSRTYTYPALANGSVRIPFSISGDMLRMTITAVGSPTASDTITAMLVIPAVFT